MTNRKDDDNFILWFSLIVSLLFLLCVFSVRADSVFVPIEPPKPKVCQRVCPVCGECAPMMACYDRDTKLPCVNIYDSITLYCTGKTAGVAWYGLLLKSFKISAGDYYSCDSIQWGYWRQSDLDSTYVLPHDTLVWLGLAIDTAHIPGHWEYYNWVNGKRVNMRRVK